MGMRGSDAASGALFSYVDMEARVPATHPLRTIRTIVNEVLTALDTEFEALYEGIGRQSVAPERLLRASLLQAFYSVRSERQLMEQINYNLLFRWFVALAIRIGSRGADGSPTLIKSFGFANEAFKPTLTRSWPDVPAYRRALGLRW